MPNRDNDGTSLGVSQGHENEPPKPAVRIDDDYFVWNVDERRWEKRKPAVAHQRFHPTGAHRDHE